MSKIQIPTVSIICLIGLIVIEPSVYLLLIFAAILCHELGHLCIMKMFGVGIRSVRILPVGISIVREEKLISYPREILLALSGPMINLVLFFALCRCEGYTAFFAFSNLFYGLVNLVPIKGLDGGAALENLLLCFFEPNTEARVMRAISVIFCVLLWMTGIYVVLILEGNISIFALAVFLFITVLMTKN